MLMVVAVTPGDVAPPLPPEKAMHGGEYGSFGTWAFWPPQAATWPVAPALAGVPVPATAPPAPAAPAAPPAPEVAPPPLPPDPAPVPAPDTCTTSRWEATVGTKTAMSTKARSMAARGP